MNLETVGIICLWSVPAIIVTVIVLTVRKKRKPAFKPSFVPPLRSGESVLFETGEIATDLLNPSAHLYLTSERLLIYRVSVGFLTGDEVIGSLSLELPIAACSVTRTGDNLYTVTHLGPKDPSSTKKFTFRFYKDRESVVFSQRIKDLHLPESAPVPVQVDPTSTDKSQPSQAPQSGGLCQAGECLQSAALAQVWMLILSVCAIFSLMHAFSATLLAMSKRGGLPTSGEDIPALGWWVLAFTLCAGTAVAWIVFVVKLYGAGTLLIANNRKK